MEALGQVSLSITNEYTPLPGPRFRKQGPKSGEEFRESILEPRFKEAQKRGEIILVDLDGGYGYGTSFLEEAFGGLARIYGADAVLKALTFKSEEEPYLIDDVKRYIRDCRGKDKQ
jgi:hypothetical protein